MKDALGRQLIEANHRKAGSRGTREVLGWGGGGVRADEGTDWFCFSETVTLTTYTGFTYLFPLGFKAPHGIWSHIRPCNCQCPVWVPEDVKSLRLQCASDRIFLPCMWHIFLYQPLGASQSRWVTTSKPHGEFFITSCLLFVCTVCVCVCEEAILGLLQLSLSCSVLLSVARPGLTLINLSCALLRSAPPASGSYVSGHFQLHSVICNFT